MPAMGGNAPAKRVVARERDAITPRDHEEHFKKLFLAQNFERQSAAV